MPYGSIDGVKDNLPKLKKYIKPDAAPNLDLVLDIPETVVTRVLTEISDQIDAALCQKYTVPFSPVPSVIQGITNDLAAFKISRSYMTTISAEENQQLNSLRKDAKEILASLVSGDYVIPGSSSGGSASSIESELEDLNNGSEDELFDLGSAAAWQAKV